MAGTTLSDMIFRPKSFSSQGITLIELVIVVTVMGILLTMAMPAYRNHMLRVHRTEAIQLLLQASMCQERIHAKRGSYDTGLCLPVSEQQHYQLAFAPPNKQGMVYVAKAVPIGAQIADHCGSLLLDQDGTRSIGASDVNAVKCWNGR